MMLRKFFAASAATLALSPITAAFAEDEKPITHAEVVDHNTHHLMDAMMDVFTSAFDRAGVEDRKTKEVLMARIDASIADYLSSKRQKAQLEAFMVTLSPAAQEKVQAFFATEEGREVFGALPASADIMPALTAQSMTDAEHIELMEAIIGGLMDGHNMGSALAQRAKALAYAIHELDADA